jgi:hypothetical protein
MTASKLLSIMEPLMHPRRQTTGGADFWLRMVDLWATGEAAASLGFSAARLSDQLDLAGDRTDARTREDAVLSPAAKLFSTSQVTDMLQRTSALGECWPMTNGPGCLQDKLIDAQIEAVHLGPEALQRRQVSAAMIDAEFLVQFRAWTGEMDQHTRHLPHTGIRCLTAGMRLWHWTLDQLRQQTDSRGVRLYCDARQGVTFPMADALCWLLAARSLTLDVLELGKSGRPGTGTASVSPVFSDISTVASVRAAGSVAQTCAALLLGFDGRFPVSAATRSVFDDLRTRLDVSLCGAMAARDRTVQFLRAKREN